MLPTHTPSFGVPGIIKSSFICSPLVLCCGWTQVFQLINLCGWLYVPKGNIASLALTLRMVASPRPLNAGRKIIASTCISGLLEVTILSFSYVEEPFSWIYDSSK